MSEHTLEALRAKARETGMPGYMYEHVEEPLTPPSSFDTLPSYYTEHVEEKNARVRRLLGETKSPEAFVFFADAHVRQNTMISVPIVRSILENTGVKTVIYGGDTVSAWTTEEDVITDVRYFADAFAFAKPYMVRGNHDMYGKAFEYTDSGVCKSRDEVYELIFSEQAERVCGKWGRTYYYFDSEETKTRYIVIDTNEILIPRLDEKGIWDCELSITREQVEWFIDSLCAIPSDHAAVVIGHIPFFKELRWNHYKARIFGELIEAYNARRTYSRMSWDGEDAFEVFADFSNAPGRVVLTASGHGHYDDLYVSPDGCVNLEIHCDSYANNNGGSPTARIAGSVSEAVVDVVILDRDTGIVHTVRYGAGFDREVLR